MSDGSNVRALPGHELPPNPMEIAHADLVYCSHPSLRIVEHDRAVFCSKCNRAIDPYAYILKCAQSLRQAYASHAHAERIVRELDERIGALKKEEERLRGRVARLREKTGSTIVVRDTECRGCPKHKCSDCPRKLSA